MEVSIFIALYEYLSDSGIFLSSSSECRFLFFLLRIWLHFRSEFCQDGDKKIFVRIFLNNITRYGSVIIYKQF